MASKLEVSEFTAAQDFVVHTLDGLPSSNVEGAIEHRIKKGDKIPKVFINGFLLHNREFIGNLDYKNAVPILTDKQLEEYDVNFQREKEKEKVVSYTTENLTKKMNSLGVKKFKDWAEAKFGADVIDKRKSGRNIITDIARHFRW